MRRIRWATIVTALLVASFPMASAAARIEGRTCARVGQVRVVSAVRYRCAQTPRGRRWVRVRVPTESYTAPVSTAHDPEACRLPDRSEQRRRWGGIFSAFPQLGGNLERAGTFRVAMVPIDWADTPGTDDPLARVRDQMTAFSEWHDMVSEGRVAFEWVSVPRYVRLPGTAESWSQGRSGPNHELAQAALSAADPFLDFTGVRSVFFVVPVGQRAFGESVQAMYLLNLMSPLTTAEGPVYNYSLAGAYFERPGRTIWSYWVHETGHAFLLPDLYEQRGNWGAVELAIPIGPFSGFDMMSSQDGPSRTLSAWLRWIMDWLPEGRLLCVPRDRVGTLSGMLVPIDSREPGVKTIMIPVSETRLVAIESRRPSKFDCPTTANRSGVIVYIVDTTLGHGDGMQALVAPAGRGLVWEGRCDAPQQLDAVLAAGDSVNVEGVTVSVTKVGTYDTIRVTAP